MEIARALMLTASFQRRAAHNLCLRRLSSGAHGSHTEAKYNEPGGRLFGRPSGLPRSVERMFIYGFTGTIVLLVFLYQYKPGITPEEWGRQEALRRMRERGINLDDYRYTPPEVY